MPRVSTTRQLAALLRRNVLIKSRRSKALVVAEFLVPLALVGLLTGLSNLTNYAPEVPEFDQVSLADQAFTSKLAERLYYLSPNSSEIERMLREALSLGGLQTPNIVLFSDVNASEAAHSLIDTDTGANIIGIHFDQDDPFQYTIRTPYGTMPRDDELFTQGAGCRSSLQSCAANGYLFASFSILQSLIDRVLISEEAGNMTFGPPDLRIQLMPKGEFIPDITFIQSFTAIYMVLAYSFFVSFLSVCIVAEKETKTKDLMTTMGMRDSAYWLSWGLIYAVIILVVTLLSTLIAWAGRLLVSSNMFLFFLLLFLYGLSIITLSFAMTPFFSKAATAGGLAGILTALVSCIYLAVSLTRQGFDDDGPVSAIPSAGQWVLALISPIALALSMDQALYLDNAQGGMTFDNMAKGQFPIYAALIMLAMDFVLYGLLAVYLDNVIPGPFGSRRPPLYFIKKSYWFPQKKKNSNSRLELVEDADNSIDVKNYEQVPVDIRHNNVLRIKNIIKQFSKNKTTTTAVNDISLDIYEGQITALLGHNGAGKTTLINMLSGMMSPSSGTALIHNYDISDSEDMDEIRNMTGACPQQNVLFNELSCGEHIEFFGRMRGLDEKSVQEQVITLLTNVELLDQINMKAEDLSGGQKRKLSLAIALTGDPKIVFLDEPTAGMDPSTRRSVWNVLKEKREGRVILLTTHFMDEADILADRKAVISKGQLRCVGSSLFLKNRFGVGYHLALLVEADCNHDEIKDLVTRYVPEAQLDRVHSQELVFILPLSDASVFPGLEFRNVLELLGAVEDAINKESKRFGIVNYGVSMTTLEEVFLKIGEEEESHDDIEDSRRSHSVNSSSRVRPSTEDDSHHNGNTGFTSEGARDNSAIGDLSQIPHFEIDKSKQKSQQFWGLLKIRFLYTKRNVELFVVRIVFPLIFMIISAGIELGMSRINFTSSESNPEKINLTPSLYARTQVNSSNPNATLQATAEGRDVEDFIRAMENTGVSLSFFSANTSLLNSGTHFIGTVVNNISTKGQVLDANLTLLYNDSAQHSLPVILNLVSNSFLGMVNSSRRVSVSSQTWPEVSTSLGAAGLASIGVIYVAGMAMLMAPSSFASVFIRDRTLKFRMMLRVSGLYTDVYWMAVMLADMILYSFSGLVGIVVLLAFQTRWLLYGGAFLVFFIDIIFYMPANILFSYIISYAYDKPETLDSSLGSVLIWVTLILSTGVLISDPFAPSIATILHYIFCAFVPTYPFIGTMHYLSRLFLDTQYQTGVRNPPIPVSKYFHPDSNLLPTIIFPPIQVILLFIILRILDVRAHGGNFREALGLEVKDKPIPEENEYLINDEDSDVTAERSRVKGLQPEEAVVVTKNLQKEFPRNTANSCDCTTPKSESTRLAVKNTTFAVSAGDVFGLLGPNGAGKTTTLNTMIAEIAPTRGSVAVAGYNIHSNLSKAYSMIGFCPQEDCNAVFVTLRENIEFFCGVHGIRKADIPTLTDYYLKALEIEEHADKLCVKLSGGTKRKLSFIVSMLGKPVLVLMDEPSTGMDPKSKRFLWDTISSGFHRGDKAAILTTHYMDEADALCSRVGIMVNGQLEALGSTQHLKNKYGSGYILELKVSTSNENGTRKTAMSDVQTFVKNLMPAAEEKELFGERVIYKVPQSDITAISKIFAAMEAEKDSLGIEEYSFSQSTLEQVFLELARHQVEEGDDSNEEPRSHNVTVARNISTEATESTDPQMTSVHL